MEVEVLNLTKRKGLEKEVAILVAAGLAEAKARQGSLSLALVGQARMKRLNQKWRNKNQVTDVLSFSFEEKAGKKKQKTIIDGEILICPDWVEKQARLFKKEFFNELTRVVVHGILHLQGWEHEGEKEEACLMLARQEKIVAKIAKKRNKI